jgi:hypothetical protein
LPPPIKAELEAAAKKHGFKDFNDYDEVTNNITMVMAGLDSRSSQSLPLQSRKRYRRLRPTKTFPRRTKSKCWMS